MYLGQINNSDGISFPSMEHIQISAYIVYQTGDTSEVRYYNQVELDWVIRYGGQTVMGLPWYDIECANFEKGSWKAGDVLHFSMIDSLKGEEIQTGIILTNQEPQVVHLNAVVSNIWLAEDKKVQPNKFKIYQNYPNPFSAGGGSAFGGNPETEIKYTIAENAFVDLSIYNMLGQKITTLVNTNLQRGNYSVKWNGTDQSGNHLGSGIYIAKMKANDFVGYQKMFLLR